MKKIFFLKAKNNKGFVILFAVTLASILLAIAVGAANIALKEVNFGTSAKDTNDAFVAADTGAECALFYDRFSGSAFPLTGSPGQITCAGTTTTPTASYGTNTALYTFVIPNLSKNNGSCAKVTVSKNQPSGQPIQVTVVSTGYNIGISDCTSTNTNRVARELKLTSLAGAPPPPSGKAMATCTTFCTTVQPGNGYRYHIFDTVGAGGLDFSSGGPVDYLVVGGGGGGGGGENYDGNGDGGGGGGGGGFVSGSASLSAGVYSINVGAGGAGGSGWGSNGGNSAFYTFTAAGGGGGAQQEQDGLSGGSGGGAGGTCSYPKSGGSGTGGQGYGGGNNIDTGCNDHRSGSGGGGAGGAGGDTTTSTPGNGGSGMLSNLTGSTYAGGGGGGKGDSYSSGSGGSGGSGGGGAGGAALGNGGGNGVAGTAKTGGGGGGGARGTGGPVGGDGGSGIVIVRYAYP